MYKAPSFGLGMKKDLRESIESVYDINNTINEEEQLIISLFEEFLKENFHVEMLTEEDIDYILENEFPQWLEEQKNRSFIGRVLDYLPGYKSNREDLERGRKQTLSQNLGNFAREIPNALLAATPVGRAAKVLRSAAPAVSKALQKSAKRVPTSGSKKGPSQASQASKSTKETGEGDLPIFLKKTQQPQMQGGGQQAVQLGPPPVPKPTSGNPSRLMSRIKTSQEIEAFQKAFQKAAQKASRNVSKKPPPLPSDTAAYAAARNAARNVSQKPPPLPSDTAAYAASRIAAQKASQKAVKAVTDDFIAALKNLPPRSSSVSKIPKQPSGSSSQKQSSGSRSIKSTPRVPAITSALAAAVKSNTMGGETQTRGLTQPKQTTTPSGSTEIGSNKKAEDLVNKIEAERRAAEEASTAERRAAEEAATAERRAAEEAATSAAIQGDTMGGETPKTSRTSRRRPTPIPPLPSRRPPPPTTRQQETSTTKTRPQTEKRSRRQTKPLKGYAKYKKEHGIKGYKKNPEAYRNYLKTKRKPDDWTKKVFNQNNNQ